MFASIYTLIIQPVIVRIRISKGNSLRISKISDIERDYTQLYYDDYNSYNRVTQDTLGNNKAIMVSHKESFLPGKFTLMNMHKSTLIKLHFVLKDYIASTILTDNVAWCLAVINLQSGAELDNIAIQVICITCYYIFSTTSEEKTRCLLKIKPIWSVIRKYLLEIFYS